MAEITFDGLIVFCSDVRASAAFYEQILGLDREWGDEHHVSLHLPTKGNDAGASLFLHPQTEPVRPPHPLGTFSVADVDALNARLLAAGFRTLGEPYDEAWGVRQVDILDPDGYQLTLAAPLKNA